MLNLVQHDEKGYMEQQHTVLTYLDSYCERAGDPSLWGEPVNAVTNLFFLIAAVAAALAAWNLPNRRFAVIGDIWLLCAALFAIGIGSGLWHLQPNGHTVLMDVLPITAFINIYLIAALRRFFRLNWGLVAALWLLYTGFGVLAQMQLPADMLHGTIMYIPTYLTLLVLSAAIWRKNAVEGRVFLPIVVVWTASLMFRTVDIEICEQFPLGTHFLWHTLNAWVLYRLLRALIQKA